MQNFGTYLILGLCMTFFFCFWLFDQNRINLEWKKIINFGLFNLKERPMLYSNDVLMLSKQWSNIMVFHLMEDQWIFNWQQVKYQHLLQFVITHVITPNSIKVDLTEIKIIDHNSEKVNSFRFHYKFLICIFFFAFSNFE